MFEKYSNKYLTEKLNKKEANLADLLADDVSDYLGDTMDFDEFSSMDQEEKEDVVNNALGKLSDKYYNDGDFDKDLDKLMNRKYKEVTSYIASQLSEGIEIINEARGAKSTEFTKPGKDGDIYFSKREGNAVAVRQGDLLQSIYVYDGEVKLGKIQKTDKRWENMGEPSEKLLIDLKLKNVGGLATKATQTEAGKLIYDFLSESVNEDLSQKLNNELGNIQGTFAEEDIKASDAEFYDVKPGNYIKFYIEDVKNSTILKVKRIAKANGLKFAKDLDDMLLFTESVNEARSKYQGDPQLFKGDTVKLLQDEWEVIETDYKPNKVFKDPFTFTGTDYKQSRAVTKITNKDAVGYKVKTIGSLPMYGFLYQYIGSINGELYTKLAIKGVPQNESVVNEAKDPVYKKGQKVLIQLTFKGGVGKFADSMSKSKNTEEARIVKRIKNKITGGYKYELSNYITVHPSEIVGLAESEDSVDEAAYDDPIKKNAEKRYKDHKTVSIIGIGKFMERLKVIPKGKYKIVEGDMEGRFSSPRFNVTLSKPMKPFDLAVQLAQETGWISPWNYLEMRKDHDKQLGKSLMFPREKTLFDESVNEEQGKLDFGGNELKDLTTKLWKGLQWKKKGNKYTYKYGTGFLTIEIKNGKVVGAEFSEDRSYDFLKHMEDKGFGPNIYGSLSALARDRKIKGYNTILMFESEVNEAASNIRKEYDSLKKASISFLRSEWSRNQKVGNPKELDKAGLISDLLRWKFGNKKVAAEFGLDEANESWMLPRFEGFVNENENRVYGMFTDDQGKPGKLDKELLDIALKGLPSKIVKNIDAVEANGYGKSSAISPPSVSNKGQSRGTIEYHQIGIGLLKPMGKNKITAITLGLRKRTSGPGTGYLYMKVAPDWRHNLGPDAEGAIEFWEDPASFLQKLYNEKFSNWF